VLNPGETVAEEEIIEYCVTRLKRFKSLKRVTFLEAFPKNLVGKIFKKELRKLG
jgi:long-chain acyl-CoA synthetase